MEHISKKVLGVIEEVAILEDIDKKKSLDIVLAYIAVNGLYGSEMIVSVKDNTMRLLDTKIDLSELTESKVDFLGECYYEIYQKTPLLDNVNCDKILIDNSITRFPQLILLENVETGKRGIKIVKNAVNGIIIYGISQDITQYRIAILNTHLFELPMFTLYIEPAKNISKIDLRTSSRNWNYANRWVPTRTLLLDEIE